MSTSANTASSREQQKQATRKQIIDAAISCFARLGYDGSNFREITDACGVQRALVLYHFQTKENLWRVAVEEVERRFTAAFDDRYCPQSNHTDREKIRHTLDCYIDAMQAVPEYAQILMREGCAPGPRLDWLSCHFAPQRSLRLQLDDPQLEKRLKQTIVRDILASTLLSFTALAPLLDASLAAATKQRSTGIYPLNPKRKKELIELLLQLVMADS